MNTKDVRQLAHNMNASLIETHISWVLLTKRYAYKIKKPVKTSFLNFSTLKLRKKYCLEELRLNQQYSKNIYLRVDTIRKTDIGFTFGGKGETEDYAVVMKLLDSKKQMNNLLKENRVTATDIRRLAKTIASIHQKAPNKPINKYLHLKDEFLDLYSVIKSTKIFTPAQLKKYESHFSIAVIFLKQHKRTFSERQKNGMIREIHGDLHSRNIFLYKQPILFDRIEFSKNLRCIDLLHELSFLCLDIEIYKREDLSLLLIKKYLKQFPYEPNLYNEDIFNFYKCYAANIRAKINLLSIQNGDKKNSDSFNQFKRYYDLMLHYLQKLPKSL